MDAWSITELSKQVDSPKQHLKFTKVKSMSILQWMWHKIRDPKTCMTFILQKIITFQKQPILSNSIWLQFSLRNKYNNQSLESLESPSFFSPPGTLNNRCFLILGYQLWWWFQKIWWFPHHFQPITKLAEKWGTTRMSPPFHAPKNQTNADQVALQPWLRWPNSPRLRKDIPWWFETELGNADVWGSFFKTRGGNPGGFLKGKKWWLWCFGRQKYPIRIQREW